MTCADCARLRRTCGNHQPPLDGLLAASLETAMKLDLAAPRPAPLLTVEAIRHSPFADPTVLARMRKLGWVVVTDGSRVCGKRGPGAR